MNPNRLMYGNVCVTCEINYCNWARDLFVGDREACYTKRPQPTVCQCDSFISKHFLELKWMGDNNISLRCLMMWQSWIPTITTLQVWLHLLCLPLQRVHVAVRCLCGRPGALAQISWRNWTCATGAHLPRCLGPYRTWSKQDFGSNITMYSKKGWWNLLLLIQRGGSAEK